MTEFVRDDWNLFRSVSGLCQKGGVSQSALPRLVLKELVDNALDAGGTCRIFHDQKSGRYVVEDDGPGIDGGGEVLARLFSIVRPLTSSKYLRLPTRGALGNGLRVVTGSVLATGGYLAVSTLGRKYELIPSYGDGTTSAKEIGPYDRSGTAVVIGFGDGIDSGDNTLSWAQAAINMADGGTFYRGKTSAWWYDSDSFHELCLAAKKMTVRELVAEFDGLTGKKTGEVTADLAGRAAASLTRTEADVLLARMREHAKQVNPGRLGSVGRDKFPGTTYKSDSGEFTIRPSNCKHSAVIPYVVEAWAASGCDSIEVWVNRTPITGDVHAYHTWDKEFIIEGCGLSHRIDKIPKKLKLNLHLHITTPYMPITSDGKAPDLSRFVQTIAGVVIAAARSLSRQVKVTAEPGDTQKSIIRDRIDEAIAQASGDGQYRYSLRQLFYVLRPHLLEITDGKEPNYTTFGSYITDIEAELGHDLPGIVRDDRGSIYHPHLHQTIPLGTESVEHYSRPEWTFNKVLYIEKEGFFTILEAAHWPERWDCALMTSKGHATRAVKDLIDLMGEDQEEVTFYCIHDADAAGTMIYQALQEETRARGARKVKIVNLGLEPWEADAMGLQVEKVESGDRRKPVADYVRDYQKGWWGWDQWLQRNRVELNAMDAPTFLSWLDQKMKEHGAKKIIPPSQVMAAHLRDETRGNIRRLIVERILRDAKVEDQVEQAAAIVEPLVAVECDRLNETVEEAHRIDQSGLWKATIDSIAAEIAENARL